MSSQPKFLGIDARFLPPTRIVPWLTPPKPNTYAIVFSLCFLLGLITSLECASWSRAVGVKSIPDAGTLIYAAVLWLWWGCIASIIWYVSSKRPFIASLNSQVISAHLAVACVLGVAHLLLLGSVGFVNSDWQFHNTASEIWTGLLRLNRFGIEVLLYGFVFGIAGVAQYQIRGQRDAMRALELQHQLSEAHLRALQMQLEPHFLFNTLNAITTLVEFKRSEEAAQMLYHLNAILKRTLERRAPEKVPLSQELEIVENYLAIERVRFTDRLRIEIKVEPAALDGLVPCFLLQPIVENAIRHGIAHCEDNGLVEVTARREDLMLHLSVRDSGSRSKRPPTTRLVHNGHGIGLRNTRERLAHFYQDGYFMGAEPLKTGGFEVGIRIPYERVSR